MLSAFKDVHCQHRSDDFPAMLEIIAPHKPRLIVELGTDRGGLALWFANAAASWGGHVVTVDNVKRFDEEAEREFEKAGNLQFMLADALGCSINEATETWLAGQANPAILHLITRPAGPVLLYTDNGHKMTELAHYAPRLWVGDVIGTHDYGSEVDPEWAEPFLALHGYAKLGHEKMEALRNEWYPEPMTRFWHRLKPLHPTFSDLPVPTKGAIRR